MFHPLPAAQTTNAHLLPAESRPRPMPARQHLPGLSRQPPAPEAAGVAGNRQHGAPHERKRFECLFSPLSILSVCMGLKRIISSQPNTIDSIYNNYKHIRTILQKDICRQLAVYIQYIDSILKRPSARYYLHMFVLVFVLRERTVFTNTVFTPLLYAQRPGNMPLGCRRPVELLQNRSFEECVFQVTFPARFQLNATCDFIGSFQCGK